MDTRPSFALLAEFRSDCAMGLHLVKGPIVLYASRASTILGLIFTYTHKVPPVPKLPVTKARSLDGGRYWSNEMSIVAACMVEERSSTVRGK